MKSYSYITKELLNVYTKRKARDVLSIIVDVKNKKIYAVPVDKEHVEFVAGLLDFGIESLKTDPQTASHLVPVNIGIDDNEVNAVLTGWSGLEAGFKVRHSNKELNDAHEIAWVFINNSVKKGTVKVGILKVNKPIFLK